MSDVTSRGEDIRNYSAAFKKGAKVPLACLSAGIITGVTSAAITSGFIKNGNVTNVKLAANAVTSAKIKAAFLSGTLVSGQIVKAVAHGLGVKPKCVVVAPLLTKAQAISATYLNVVLCAASAATSTNFYIIGNQPTNGAIKYVAYVQL